MKPKISVIMSVHNGKDYIRESIESILSQTFSNFEFLIIDDNSTDGTEKILKTFGDKRIKLIKNKKRLGLTESLNIGLKKAQGDYVARMDADDISLPQRFTKQVDFLEENRQIGLVGSWVEYIGPRGESLEIKKYPQNHKELLNVIMRYNPFKHPTLMIRREILKRIGGYNEKFKYAQDYDLVLKIASISKVANIPEVLLRYRIEPKASISFKNMKAQEKFAILARIEALKSGKYPLYYAVFLIKPLVFYFIPSGLKIFLLTRFFWKFQGN